jgi:hypothetical protein
MSKEKLLDEITVMAKEQEGRYAYPYLWGMSKSLLSEANLKIIHKILTENKVNV